MATTESRAAGRVLAHLRLRADPRRAGVRGRAAGRVRRRGARSCWTRASSAAPSWPAARRSTSCEETADVREGDWQVAPAPDDLQQRWVEITGPTERKMVINALNSGADGFMADFEDANAPSWRNMIEGHINLRDAIEGTITYDGSDGRHYELGENPATLLVRPRGWHLPERHLLAGGEPGLGLAVRLRHVLLSLRAAAAGQGAAARTSTCPRWSPISRRGCGTTCSSTPRSGWGSRRGRSRRPC